MELFGKVVSPSRGLLNLNGNEELLVNAKSNRVTLSGGLLNKLDWADKAVGFGYDPAKELGSATVFIYLENNIEEGCKVGKSGTVTNKFHTEKLADAFKNETGGANRFKLDVDADNAVTHPSGVVLYPVTFIETLADINRTKSTTDKSAEEATNESMDLGSPLVEEGIPMEAVTAENNEFTVD